MTPIITYRLFVLPLCRPTVLEALSGGGADLCAAARNAFLPQAEATHTRRNAPKHAAGRTLALQLL